MSISYHAAAIEAHTPFCLLLQIQGEEEGTGWQRKQGRERDNNERRNQLKTTFTVDR